MNISWKDIFDCGKIFPLGYFDCLDFIKQTTYQYFAYNGNIYNIKNECLICKEEQILR